MLLRVSRVGWTGCHHPTATLISENSSASKTCCKNCMVCNGKINKSRCRENAQRAEIRTSASKDSAADAKLNTTMQDEAWKKTEGMKLKAYLHPNHKVWREREKDGAAPSCSRSSWVWAGAGVSASATGSLTSTDDVTADGGHRVFPLNIKYEGCDCPERWIRASTFHTCEVLILWRTTRLFHTSALWLLSLWADNMWLISGSHTN